MNRPFVEFKNLKAYFHTTKGIVKSVNDVSFEIQKGETVGIVGESGCGKSVTALSLMKLLPSHGKISGGDILFEGNSILSMNENEIRKIRGNDISMIFQEPMTSLNPSLTVGNQISEVIILHQKLNKIEARNKAIEMIKLVEISRPKEIFNSYPHELSGGMRQRIMIAIALSCNPKLLIADEPTTALDVTIQSQILDLMKNIKSKFNTSIMLITHDLGVVAEMCDKVVVMYAGKVVEIGSVYDIFKNPKHPYTKGLLKSTPSFLQNSNKLYSIPGQVPNPIDIPDYCYFSERCEKTFDKCKINIPPLRSMPNKQKVACWLYEEEYSC
ncbi:ABC transporter ATP-binding protein [Paraclostridium sordellii]|uniref:ABC transporter ATP-binding protein n=1 Tax=Paraclostridium sordellii TaxID=1505 RepID=UPI0005DCF15B|nr:ABC transporter ATP-binding protein [Paeniclostridium sordellii]CEO07932.1 ABC transporter ATP-binding protein; putative oligopeptide transport system [[Clostridium] sordellii] [Paeniclostridium sordellii]CEP87040.1 ABC transporter ATP-binding protein; putative oligopeptide transport system [[Clostridium] sordellii] [Paeniclostridium sordellii]CEP95377.1 ABC transporter ATP-binding protein; putative oligopeptide transport system [[Clostridium] sordellii] [Paeniclostridium sordellii]CEP99283.